MCCHNFGGLIVTRNVRDFLSGSVLEKYKDTLFIRNGKIQIVFSSDTVMTGG